MSGEFKPKSGRLGKQQARELTAHQPTRPDGPSKGKLNRLITYVGFKRPGDKGILRIVNESGDVLGFSSQLLGMG
jgi:hypothetical protein